MTFNMAYMLVNVRTNCIQMAGTSVFFSLVSSLFTAYNTHYTSFGTGGLILLRLSPLIYFRSRLFVQQCVCVLPKNPARGEEANDQRRRLIAVVLCQMTTLQYPQIQTSCTYVRDGRKKDGWKEERLISFGREERTYSWPLS